MRRISLDVLLVALNIANLTVAINSLSNTSAKARAKDKSFEKHWDEFFVAAFFDKALLGCSILTLYGDIVDCGQGRRGRDSDTVIELEEGARVAAAGEDEGTAHTLPPLPDFGALGIPGLEQ